MATLADLQAIFSTLEQTHQPTMLEQLKEFTPFQLLVATLLSARTKDVTTIPIVRRLFEQYPTPHNLMKAKDLDLQKTLYGIGFYKTKSKHVKQLSRIVVEKYHGEIRNTFEELTSLPGVGPKTANCILNYAFHKPAIAVDTHVHRISNRLGWVKTNTPEETEATLKRVIPTGLWSKVNMLLVDHGQRICLPRTPKCSSCPIRDYCDFDRNRAKEKAVNVLHKIKPLTL